MEDACIPILRPFDLFYGHLIYFTAFGKFCGHLVNFVVIRYIFLRFGKLYEKKSGNPASKDVLEKAGVLCSPDDENLRLHNAQLPILIDYPLHAYIRVFM
jgi:hypothetical protein